MSNSTLVHAALGRVLKNFDVTTTQQYWMQASEYTLETYKSLELCTIKALKNVNMTKAQQYWVQASEYVTESSYSLRLCTIEPLMRVDIKKFNEYWMKTADYVKNPWKPSALVWCFSASVLLRLTRRWVQSGQKFAGAPDIVGHLRIDAPHVLWILVTLTLLDATYTISERSFSKAGSRHFASITIPSILFFTTILFKVKFAEADEPEVFGQYLNLVTEATRAYTFGNLVTWARIVFLGVGLSFATTVYLHIHKHHKHSPFIEHLHPLLALLLITQSRLANIPLFFIFSMQLRILRKFPLKPIQISLATVLLAHVSFFAMGGTNSISTVDLSQAYNGIADYNISLVGILLFIGNWAGPIYWSTAGLVLLSHNRKKSSTQPTTTLFDAWLSHVELLTFWSATSVASVMAACLALRTHLFVWTVFSPKFLYVVAWAVGWHGVINVILGGVLASVG